jgi:transcriptional regulator NrdR family protein
VSHPAAPTEAAPAYYRPRCPVCGHEGTRPGEADPSRRADEEQPQACSGCGSRFALFPEERITYRTTLIPVAP